MTVPRMIARSIAARPRLLIAFACGIAVWLGEPEWITAESRVILAMDIGAILFLALSWSFMLRASTEHVRLRAKAEDEGKWVMLILTIGAAIVSLTVIGLQLHGIKDAPEQEKPWHLGLAGATILCSWLVTHTLFAQHYAHSYFSQHHSKAPGRQRGGLLFPGDAPPDYLDFMYFSLTIGMTAQVSDVEVADSGLRRLVALHSVLSFFFNTVILALVINISAGLI